MRFEKCILFCLCVVLMLSAKCKADNDDSQPPGNSEGCQPEKMTVYKMILHTFWTRDRFPKHYPDWRPPAQWSQVHGQTHNHSYVLFRLGKPVSSAVRTIAEGHPPGGSNGPEGRGEVGGAYQKSSAPQLGAQGYQGVLDAFTAPPIGQGAGRTEAEFYVDGNHSKVSLISKMIPSPDWFVGVDSFDLCVNGNWLDSITIEVDPVDAGTDNGFTFTAPNWPTQPQGVAFRLTSRYPAHPAGSFYYPQMKRLPPIATFQFLKLREYELTETFHHSADERSYEVLKSESPGNVADNNINILDGNNALSLAIEEERAERNPHSVLKTLVLPPKDAGLPLVTVDTNSKGEEKSHKGLQSARVSTTVEPRENNEVPRGDKGAILNSIARSYRGRRRKHHHHKSRPKDCRVSDWGEWSTCSRTCGIGETRRTRKILRAAMRGGAACPPTLQTRWCGSARDCPQGYFNW